MSEFFNSQNMNYLYGWLRYSDFVTSSSLINNDRNLAISPSSLILISPILKTSLDGNFKLIAEWFLNNYCIPDNLISLIKCFMNKEKINCEKLSFNEEITYLFFEKDYFQMINNIPEKYVCLRETLTKQLVTLNTEMAPIMVVFGPNYYLELIYPILQFLIDTVSHIVYMLKSYQETGGSFFLRQTAPCKFLSQFEIKVAQSIFDKTFYTIDTCKNDIAEMFPTDVKEAKPYSGFNDLNEMLTSLNDITNTLEIGALDMQSTKVDGFVTVYEPDVGENIDHGINTISSYTNTKIQLTNIFPRRNSKYVLVDQYWGFAYNETFLLSDFAIYGGKSIPVNFSEKATGGYLSVPFRKIPCINVNSADELMATVKEVISKYQFGRKMLFRGQTDEYYLNRDKDSLKRLYDDENARELSLLPSSARSNESFEDVYPAWSFLVSHFKTKMNIPAPESLHYIRFMYNLSLAQHYGLPSCGLDLTDDIGTALFFALNHYVKGSPSKYIKKEKGKSVIYILECDSQDTMPYTLFDNDKEISRPKAQNAYFFSTGWGLSSNRAARQVRAAIYFDASIVFPQAKSVDELFPKDDSFISYLKGLRNDYNIPVSMNRWLDKIYYI